MLGWIIPEPLHIPPRRTVTVPSRIGGHDSFAGSRAGFHGVRKLFRHHGDPGGDFVQRDVRTDDAGGANQHRGRRNAEHFAGIFGRATAQVQAGLSGGGVGDAGIDHHSLRRAAGTDKVHVPEDRGGFHLIGGEHAGGGTGNAAEDHGHIRAVPVLNARRAAGGAETFCGGNAAGNVTDHRLLLL